MRNSVYLEELRKIYKDLEFKELDADNPELLCFNKHYPFIDIDGTEEIADIVIIYKKDLLLYPPSIYDRNGILNSMHSLEGFQCWARFRDISAQAGIGILDPSVIEKQILKLIEAHKQREFGTVNESPEFTHSFTERKLIDHRVFFITPDVISNVIKCNSDDFIISTIAAPFENGFIVNNNTNFVSYSNNKIIIPKPDNPHKRIFFLRTSHIPHFDKRIKTSSEFIYLLERSSGIEEHNKFLNNIEGDFFIAMVFYNQPLKLWDIVVFYKNGSDLHLMPHARIASIEHYFARNMKSSEKLRNKNIALIGLGAIGSFVGWNLLQSGIKCLQIIDNDRVEYENLSRTIYTDKDVGLLKTDAFIEVAKRKLEFFSTRVKVIEDISAILKPEVLDELDLVVVCIGDVHEEYLISRVLRKLGYEKSVYIFGQNDCTWGGIYFQDDTKLGCQQCLFLHQNEDSKLKIPFDYKPAPAVGCGGPSYEGLIDDISIIAGIATKLIIKRITEDKGINTANYYIWQSCPDFAARSDWHSDLFSIKQYRVAKHDQCDC